MTASRKSGFRPVLPYRSHRGWLALILMLLFALAVGNVYLSVQRVRYGKEIQELKRSVSNLGSEVRDLQGQKATLTSLASIESKAMSMGMVYPRKLPRLLLVPVDAEDIPPTWSSTATKRVPEGVDLPPPSLAMVEEGR
ncbi:MAG: hypothetical protein V2A56_08070 [bacterium]